MTAMIGTKKYIILCSLLAVLLLLHLAKADECEKYRFYVKRASEWYFGIDYPYWFSIGQLRVESNCIWTISRDGWKSIGVAQITPRFWDRELSVVHKAWKENLGDYFMAQAYILKKMHNQNPCKKLYVTYQCYNRSCKKVVQENWPECKWEAGLNKCAGKDVCVWKKGDKCIQWRNECDINYAYGLKIWKNGVKYQEWITNTWRYW